MRRRVDTREFVTRFISDLCKIGIFQHPWLSVSENLFSQVGGKDYDVWFLAMFRSYSRSGGVHSSLSAVLNPARTIV